MPTRTIPTTINERQLETFPNELLIQILSNIHGQSHLAKISLTSKQFQALVERLLYRHISLDVQYSAADFDNTSLVNRFPHTTIPSFVPFDRLIHNLSVRQDLGRYVHRLDLRVRRRRRHIPFATHSRLLKHLPELRTLSLSPPSSDLNIQCSNNAVTSLRLDFSHVTDHYTEGRDWLHDGVPLHILARHLGLAKLRKVQVETVYFASQFDGTRHVSIGSSSVEDLRFLNCLVEKSDSVLALILRSTQYLKRFVIELWSSTYWTVSAKTYVSSFELALLEHRETIEELAIATLGGLARIGWALCQFTQWTSLKHLAVPSYMILGISPGTRKLHEVLPPLLEEFQIEYSTAHSKWTGPQMSPQQSLDWQPTSWPGIYDSAIDADRAEDAADMRLLAANKDAYVPNLKLIIWWYQMPETSSSYYDDYPTDRTLAALRLNFTAFEKVGVKFELVTDSLFKDTPFGKRLCEWHE